LIEKQKKFVEKQAEGKQKKGYYVGKKQHAKRVT
jgi:hypothetical protein